MFDDLIPKDKEAGAFADLVPNQPNPNISLDAPVGSEGFLGGVADYGRGLAKGTLATVPKMIGKAAEFFGAPDAGRVIQDFAAGQEKTAPSKSIIGQREHENSIFSPRGAAYEAGENTPLSVLPGVAGAIAGGAAGSVVGPVGTLAGAAGGYLVGSLAALPVFYGSQAQESKEAIKAGLLKSGVPEVEAEAQANKGGHASGAIEAGGELLADLIPFGALAKPFAKPIAGSLVKSFLGGQVGKGLKTIGKIEAGEVATEMAQTAGESEVEKQFGSGGEGATLKGAAEVAVPTALMALLPGGLTVAHNFHTAGKIKSALESGDADAERRTAAAATVFHNIKEQNPLVARAFDLYAADQIEAEKPIEIGNDQTYLDHYDKAMQELAKGYSGPEGPLPASLTQQSLSPSQKAGIDPNAGPLSAAAATAIDTGASAEVNDARQAPLDDAAQAAQVEKIQAENPELSDEEVARKLQKSAEDESLTSALDDSWVYDPESLKNRAESRRAQAGKDMGTDTQPLTPKMMPFKTAEAAQTAATAQAQRTGDAYEVVPHPLQHDKFTIIPAGKLHEFTKPPPEEKKAGGQTIEGESKRVPDVPPAKPALPAPKEETSATSAQSEETPQPVGPKQDVGGNQANGPGQEKAAEGSGQETVDEGAHEAAASPQNDLTPPTQGQAGAGNYKTGPTTLGPVNLKIENPEGSQRTNLDVAKVLSLAHSIPTDTTPLAQKGKAKLAEAITNTKQGDHAAALDRIREASQLLLAAHPEQSEELDRVASESWATTMQAHYGYDVNAKGADKDKIDWFVKPGTPIDHAGPIFVIDQTNKDGSFDEHKAMGGYASAPEAIAAYKAHYPKDFKVGKITQTTPEEYVAWTKSGDTSKPFAPAATTAVVEAEGSATTVSKTGPNDIPDYPEAWTKSGKPWASFLGPAPGSTNAQIIQALKERLFKARNDRHMASGGHATGTWFEMGTSRENGVEVAYIQHNMTDNSVTIPLAKLRSANSLEELTAEPAVSGPKPEDQKQADAQAKKNAVAEAKAKAAEEKKQAAQKKQAVRTAQADLFNALKGHVRLIAAADKTTNEFEAEVIDLAGDWLKEQRAGADEIRNHGLTEARTDITKISVALQEDAKKKAKKIADEKAKADKLQKKAENPDKLRNTGDDLRRHWELEKAKKRAQNDAEGITGMNRIFALTTRADLFDVLAPDATPGAQNMRDRYRDKVKTFKDWTVEDGPLSDLRGSWGSGNWRSRRQAGGNARIEAFIKGTAYISGESAKRFYRGIIPDEVLDGDTFFAQETPTVGDRLQLLRNAADEYMSQVGKLTAPIAGKTRAADVYSGIRNLMWKPLQTENGQSRWIPGTSRWRAMNDEFLTPEGIALKASKVFTASEMASFADPQSFAMIIADEEKAGVFDKDKKERLVPPRLETIRRTIPKQLRNGNVTPKQFKETFGFADVGFGTWVKSKEDQAHLNFSYDAFMDMANLLGIDPKQIGFGGNLHFVIGALGHGAKAAATFHPQHPGPNGTYVKAINVTKTRGDGTVAHEWFHALDDHLSGTPEGSQIMKDLRNRLAVSYGKSFDRAKSNAMSWLNSKRSRRETRLDNAAQNLRYYRHHTLETDYKINADKLDADYWGNPQELRARGWEAYIGDHLDGLNEYLVNPAWSGDGATTPPKYRGTPYPKGEERKQFNEVYKALVSSLIVKDGTLAIDKAKWDSQMTDAQAAYLQALDDMEADLPNIMAQIEAEEEAATAAQIKEQEDAQRAAAEAQAREEAAANPEPETPPAGEMTDDDLEALFDAAAEDVQAKAAENSQAPEPGEQGLNEDTTTAAPEKFEPTTSESIRPPGPRFEVTGNKLSTNAPEVSHVTAKGKTLLGVIWPAPSLFAAKAVDQFTFKKNGGFFIRNEHLIRTEAAPTTSTSTVAAPKNETATALITEAAKLGVKGIDEALTGLTKLFGGGKIQSFPGGFDQKTYDEAKPHFVEALKAFQAAGKTLKDLFALLISKFGEGVKPYAIHFAKDMKLTATLGNQPGAHQRLAAWVTDSLRNGLVINSMQLFRKADDLFGGTMGEGKYTPKDAYDLVEAGMNAYILERKGAIDLAASPYRAAEIIGGLKKATDLLPTQTKRTGEQDEFQQFSTPPALAFVANWVAGIRSGETYMEPSAGIGGLAVFGKLAGANIVANELSARRAEILRMVLPSAQVTQENAEMIHDILPDSVTPTVVVMNPPFSATAGRVPGQRDTMTGAQHVTSALSRLEPGGRLVAIVGDMNETSERWVKFWDGIKGEYTVRANIKVSGAEYAKYGTTFDNRIIVIDKVGPQNGAVIVRGEAEQFSDLPGMLDDVRRLRREPSRDNISPQPVGPELSGGDTTAPGLEGTGQTQSPATGQVGPRTGNIGGDTGTSGNAGAGGVRGPATGTGRSGTGDGQTGGGDRTGRSGRSGPETGVGTGTGSDQGPVGSGVTIDAEAVAKRDRELTDNVFESYEPLKAKLVGSRTHPSPLVESAAMASVEPVDAHYKPNLPNHVIVGVKDVAKKDGAWFAKGSDDSLFAPDAKGFKTEADAREYADKVGISDAQIEVVIYAGQAHSQMLQSGARRGYFVGDGTGVGKGREVSAIIMDNVRQGRPKHLWLSAKSGLMKDAVRDWNGVGGSSSQLFTLSDESDNAMTKVARKDGVMFTTYATLRQPAKVNAKSVFPAGSAVVVQDPLSPRTGTAELVGFSLTKQTVKVRQGEKVTVHPFAQINSIAGDTNWRSALTNKNNVTRSRFDQIAEWLGDDFDGVIAFDESHNMGNSGGEQTERGQKEASAQALAGSQLQERFPLARVVYVSATGATEVSNLMYAKRLGLWGDGTAFANDKAFVDEISTAGLSTMEIVARDLKSQGSYIARSISYDGVTYGKLDAPLTQLQGESYDVLAKAWQIVLRDIKAAMKATQMDKSKDKGSIMSQFWGTQLRFFSQVITAMQIPTIIEDAKREIANGNAVVFQLVNTAEATQEKLVGKAEAEGTDLEELDFSPRETLIEFVRNSYPVFKYIEVMGSDGKKKYIMAQDSAGKPIEDKAMVAKRDALIRDIEQIKSVPGSPVDQIINALGEENVAEVTGRSRRFLTKISNGELKVEEQARGPKAADADARAFIEGKKMGLIFSDAGGTGFSYHSDRGYKNQARRIHYLVQPGWRADNAVQGFGRTHRTNEANQPHYVLPQTDLKAQKRFISSIARRLDQLGALTKGQRNTSSGGMFTNRDNLESKYAQAALRALLEDLSPFAAELSTNTAATELAETEDADVREVRAAFGDRLPSGGTGNRELIDAMGLEGVYDQKTRQLIPDKVPPMRKFLNRLLSLTREQQNFVFGEFEKRMDAAVDAAIEKGTFDDGMQTIKADRVIKTRDDVVYTDERTKATTRYVELELQKPTTLNDWQQANAVATLHPGRGTGYYIDNQSGQVFIAIDEGSRPGGDGRLQHRGYRINVRAPSQAQRGVYVINMDAIKNGGSTHIFRQDTGQPDPNRPGRTLVHERRGTRYEEIPADVAQYLWAEQLEAEPKSYSESMHILAGILLPVWDRVKVGKEGKPAAVVRTQTDDGERFIGRLVPEADRSTILKNFGLGAIRADIPAADLIERIFAGETALLSNGWQIKKSKVAGENRMEITASHVSDADKRALQDKGAIVIRDNWQDRIFIPTGTNQLQMFEALTRGSNRPVVDFVGKKEPLAGEPKFNVGGIQASRGGALAKLKEGWDQVEADPKVQAEGGGMSRADVWRTIRPVTKTWKNAPTFSIVQTAADLPFNAPKQVRGAFASDGTVYLVAENLRNPNAVMFVALHEIMGHYGLRGILGTDLDGMMEKIYHSNEAVRKDADARRKAYADHGVELSIAGATEEALADMAGRNRLGEVQGWRLLVAAIRNGLRKLGFDLAMSDSDVIALLAGARRYVETGERSDVPQINAEPKASLGLVTDTSAFRNWFGNSKVVDENGKPLGVYHGTDTQRTDGENAIETFVGKDLYAADDPTLPVGWFSERADLAENYALKWGEDSEGPHIYKVYLSIKKPFDLSAFGLSSNDNVEKGYSDSARTILKKNAPWVRWQDYEGAVQVWEVVTSPSFVEGARSAGYDGLKMTEAIRGGNEERITTWAPFASGQVKSAISNNGDFNTANPGIMFSLATDGLIGAATQEFYDRTQSAKQFNWLHRRVSTQFHKAQINPYFRPVFVSAQRFIQDVSGFAHSAADEAGEEMLPRLGRVSDVFKNATKTNQINRDIKAAGKAIWAATLGEMRPTQEQLAHGFTVTAKDEAGIIGDITVPPLTEDQMRQYNRTRDAIDLSLDQVAVSEMARKVRGMGIDDVVLQAAKDDASSGYNTISTILHEIAANHRASGNLQAAAKVEGLIAQTDEDQARVEQLKAEGYAPLMRFGQYTVHVEQVLDGAKPTTLYYGMFETKREANRMAREMSEQYPNAVVTPGVMDEESWKLYRGMSLDSIHAFAQAAGLGGFEPVQDFLRLATSSRSALKRLIHRKGIQGYDEDLRRVLASFITSQARLASRNYHFAEMTDAHALIPKEMGDVREEAAQLIGYVQNPTEEASAIRGMLFVNFIGGSVASALTNMTQPVMMTLPYLSQFGGPGHAAKAMKDALEVAGGGVSSNQDLQAAMDRAAKAGITEPQELHQLYAESIRGMGSNIWARKGLRVWGSMFSLAESFNRRITFAAAFQLAQRPGALEEINRVRNERNLPGFADSYEFAESAVEDTQGIYNRGNRPNWARGAIGATLFTFKQYTIAYLEFLTRLPPRERALAGALLLLAAGLQGAPGADDLENLIDTIGQLMGYNTNSKKSLREGAVKILGESMGGFITHGFSGIPGVPLDVAGRLGINQLIPGSGIFKRSQEDKGQDFAQAVGPIGGIYTQAQRAVTAAEAGQWGTFFAQGTPIAIQNALKGIDMWQTGVYKDTKGRKVMDVSRTDAALKAIGIQPQDVAFAQRRQSDVRQDVSMVRTVETAISDKWARGILDHEPEKVREAIQELFRWNTANPTTPIAINPEQIRSRVQNAMIERDVRTIKSAPREVRGSVLETLRR